jgi:hypothetical protein
MTRKRDIEENVRDLVDVLEDNIVTSGEQGAALMNIKQGTKRWNFTRFHGLVSHVRQATDSEGQPRYDGTIPPVQKGSVGENRIYQYVGWDEVHGDDHYYDGEALLHGSRSHLQSIITMSSGGAGARASRLAAEYDPELRRTLLSIARHTESGSTETQKALGYIDRTQEAYDG